MLAGMRIGCLVLAVSAVLLAPLESRATSCTAQGELGSLDRVRDAKLEELARLRRRNMREAAR